MYENAQYMNDLNGSIQSIRVSIGGVDSYVPLDPANTDYQNIMALVEKGELVIAPAE